VVWSRKLPKDESHPVCAIPSDKSNAAPLDLQSWILVVPLVSHVSECSTIRTAFALPRRDDNSAETSTRLAKKGKALKANLGHCSSALLENMMAIRRQTHPDVSSHLPDLHLRKQPKSELPLRVAEDHPSHRC
jgi:hypothetical protein